MYLTVWLLEAKLTFGMDAGSPTFHSTVLSLIVQKFPWYFLPYSFFSHVVWQVRM